MLKVWYMYYKRFNPDVLNFVYLKRVYKVCSDTLCKMQTYSILTLSKNRKDRVTWGDDSSINTCTGIISTSNSLTHFSLGYFLIQETVTLLFIN